MKAVGYSCPTLMKLNNYTYVDYCLTLIGSDNFFLKSNPHTKTLISTDCFRHFILYTSLEKKFDVLNLVAIKNWPIVCMAAKHKQLAKVNIPSAWFIPLFKSLSKRVKVVRVTVKQH